MISKQKMLILAFVLGISGCGSNGDPSRSLKNRYADHFQVGAAIGKGHLVAQDTTLLKRHFSSVTAENDMKPQRTIDKGGRFTFEAGDRIVEFAHKNGMAVRGHTLVWHNQTDEWFYRDAGGEYLSKEKMFERQKWYITNVLDHYRGKVYAWDVVNEAIGNDPDHFYREDTDWFRICGPQYIEKAFVFAREADPDVKLFYNDYNLINPVKARRVYQMVKEFRDKGIPIDGIGMQGHWTLEDVNAENLARSIDLFASLGVEVQITELDISIYPFYHNIPRERIPRDSIAFTPELEKKQAEKYREVFQVLRDKSDKVTSVTFWGVADNKTWLSNFPVRGRTDHPLLFDTAYQPKKALKAITDF